MSERVDQREAAIVAGAPAGTPLWPCGHPRYPGNVQKIGEAGVRCRICRRRISNRSAKARA